MGERLAKKSLQVGYLSFGLVPFGSPRSPLGDHFGIILRSGGPLGSPGRKTYVFEVTILLHGGVPEASGGALALF